MTSKCNHTCTMNERHARDRLIEKKLFMEWMYRTDIAVRFLRKSMLGASSVRDANCLVSHRQTRCQVGMNKLKKHEKDIAKCVAKAVRDERSRLSSRNFVSVTECSEKTAIDTLKAADWNAEASETRERLETLSHHPPAPRPGCVRAVLRAALRPRRRAVAPLGAHRGVRSPELA